MPAWPGGYSVSNATVSRWWSMSATTRRPRARWRRGCARQLAGTAAADAARHVGVDAALQAAMAQAGPGGRVLVFGSFHTAAAALGHLGADG